MLDPEIKSLLSEFDKFSFQPPAWTYAHATYPLKKKGYIFASDGHDPFIYDPDLGRYVPANDRLRSILADLYAAYKDWCAANRHNPVSAHRLYTSVWDIFRVKTRNSNGRRLFKGIRLIPETTQTGAEGAGREQE